MKPSQKLMDDILKAGQAERDASSRSKDMKRVNQEARQVASGESCDSDGFDEQERDNGDLIIKAKHRIRDVPYADRRSQKDENKRTKKEVKTMKRQEGHERVGT